MPTKVILDVDTGTDDAVALMVAALSPDLELVGVTTVNGNTTIDNTTDNTLRVFDWIGLPKTRSTAGWIGRWRGPRWTRSTRRGASTATTWTCRRPRRRRSSPGTPSTG